MPSPATELPTRNPKAGWGECSFTENIIFPSNNIQTTTKIYYVKAILSSKYQYITLHVIY
jgi:hypothetical protein